MKQSKFTLSLGFFPQKFLTLGILVFLLSNLVACGNNPDAVSTSNSQVIANSPTAMAVATLTIASPTTISQQSQSQATFPADGCLPELQIPPDFNGSFSQACVDNVQPKQKSNVNLIARLVVAGKPVEGAKAEAKWDFKFIDHTCRNLVTNKAGIILCGYDIGNATKDIEVKITVSFTDSSGQKYTTTTSFITEGKLAPATPTPLNFANFSPGVVPQQAQPEPTQQLPTATSVPPTITPRPTATSVPPTVTPRPTATARPTATPTQAPLGITFVEVTGGQPGGRANVVVSTEAGANCLISYRTPAGTSSVAAGLVAKQTADDGYVSWNWVIGGNTRPGTGTVRVNCTALDGKSGSVSSPITIG